MIFKIIIAVYDYLRCNTVAISNFNVRVIAAVEKPLL